jgi:hypothetical protein
MSSIVAKVKIKQSTVRGIPKFPIKLKNIWKRRSCKVNIQYKHNTGLLTIASTSIRISLSFMGSFAVLPSV